MACKDSKAPNEASISPALESNLKLRLIRDPQYVAKLRRSCGDTVLVEDKRVQLSTFIAAGQKVLICSGNGDKKTQ